MPTTKTKPEAKTDGRARLTDDQRAAIVADYDPDAGVTDAVLAERYGVAKSTITRVRANAVRKSGRGTGSGTESKAGEAPPKPDDGRPGASNDDDAVVLIPHDCLHPSGLNPRKAMDAEAIERLAASLRDRRHRAGGGAGILQNLVVRPLPASAADRAGETAPGVGRRAAGRIEYEITAGERRWRAVRLNVEQHGWPGDIPLPCRVVGADDADVVEIALLENLGREDLAPMEEARGLAELLRRRREDAPDLSERQFALDVAPRIGRTERHVQLRLDLVDRLAAPAQQALEDGIITLAMARQMTAAGAEMQQEVLERVEKGWIEDAREVHELVTEDLMPVSAAVFDVAAYDGGYVEDPDDPEDRYFADTARAERLQREAIEAMEAELRSKYDWVEVSPANERPRFHEYERLPDDADIGAGVGAIIDITSWGVDVHHRLRRKPAADANGTDPAGKDQRAGLAQGGGAPENKEPATRAHREHARRRKSMALQFAVAGDDTRAAKALTCLGLLGCTDAVAIDARNIAHVDHDALHPDVRAVLADFADTLPKDGRIDRCTREPVRYSPWATKQDAVWRAVWALPDGELDSLFTHLVAARVGSFAGYDAGFGDDPAALAIAESLGLPGNEAAHGLGLSPVYDHEADLEGLRKPGLARVAADLGADEGKTLKATREAIKEAAAGGDYVVPTLRFGTAEAIAAAIAPLPAGDDGDEARTK